MLFRRPTRGLRWYFEHNDGRLIHKWMHYFDIYERHFDAYRGRRITLLEIGVAHGGSLQMWRHYLGRRSTVVGVDILQRVEALSEPGIHIVIGDQADPDFLASLAARFGPFDIVIDDGSHRPEHQIASIEHLWPHVADGGVYVVEDLHANYWAEYGGGKDEPATFMSWTRERIDDLHAFHSREDGFEPNEWTRTLGGLHVYDSIVALDKTTVVAPTHRKSGRPSFDDIYGQSADAMIDDDHRQQLASLNSWQARLRRLRRDPRGTIDRALERVRR